MCPDRITPGAVVVSRDGRRFRRILRLRDTERGTMALWDEVRRRNHGPGFRVAMLKQTSPVNRLASWAARPATNDERASVLDALEVE